MSDVSNHGSVWSTSEVDVIVADYFAMLSEDLAGVPYVKAKHNALVASQIGRTRASIEFKYRNISAVLDKLGMPWIRGYRPAAHHQGNIPDAIDRYISRRPEVLDPPSTVAEMRSLSDVFVAPPSLCAPEEPVGDEVRRLIRKFDPVERDMRNRSLGQAGEKFVIQVERRRLTEIGRHDLSDRIRWISEEEGDGAGFDVLSFDLDGKERLVEVKTTNGSAATPFFLTCNEVDVATEQPDRWRLYRVHLFAKAPRIFTLAPPLQGAIRLEPQTFRACF